MGSNQRHRLRGAAAFARLFRHGRRIEGDHLQLLAAPAGGAIGQVGYVIGKQQLKLAVDRNRLKRMLREAVRRRRPALDRFDIVLRLRRGYPPAGVQAIGIEAASLLDALTTARSR